MIDLNPFAFPKAPIVKITKEVRRQLKPDNTILPSHEERDIENMRKFAMEMNLMRVGLMPKRFSEKVEEKVEAKVEEKEEPAMKIEDVPVKEDKPPAKEEKPPAKEEKPPTKKPHKRQVQLTKAKEAKAAADKKAEDAEKKLKEAEEKAKKAKEEGKKVGREEFKKELEEEAEVESSRPATIKEKLGLVKPVKLSSDMSHKEIYDKLKGKGMMDGEVLDTKKLKDIGLYPSKQKGKFKLSGEEVIDIIKTKKIENVVFK
jgi:hypothetical protein